MDQTQAIRDFCLTTIKEVYGYDYQSDWHEDLDSLLQPNGIYSISQGGSFVVKHSNNGRVIGCGGLRNLTTHQASKRRFSRRYKTQKVGALWRVYIVKNSRGQGLGGAIVAELEDGARNIGYHQLYLHTSRNNPEAVLFWQKQGYCIFAEDDTTDRTVHMEKVIG